MRTRRHRDPLEVFKENVEADMIEGRPSRRRIPSPEEIEGDYIRGREAKAEKEKRDE